MGELPAFGRDVTHHLASACRHTDHCGLHGYLSTRSHALDRTRLDNGIGTRADRPGVAIVETHDIGRSAVVAVHFDDLSHVIRLAHGVPVHVQPVTHCRLHELTSPRVDSLLPGCPPGGPGYTC